VSDRTIGIEHLVAIRAPTQNAVEKRTFPIALANEINDRSHDRYGHEREIAQVTDKHLEFEDHHIAEKRQRASLGFVSSWRVGSILQSYIRSESCAKYDNHDSRKAACTVLQSVPPEDTATERPGYSVRWDGKMV
jgi:hypothetical protein